VTVQVRHRGAPARRSRSTSRSVDSRRGHRNSNRSHCRGVPPTGRPVSITVNVKPVPGEKKTDNNKQTYQAIFTAA